MILKGNNMNLRNYNFKILDNFDNTLNDFDIVVTGLNEHGVITTIPGIYYRTAILLFNNYENINSEQNTLTIKRYNLYGTSVNKGLVDRVKVEYGDLPGTYKIKNTIKIENPDIPMKCLKDRMLKMLFNYKISGTVPRKFINEMIDDVKRLGLL